MPDVRTADERTLLTTMLDWHRQGVVAKVAGLSDESARRRLVGSNTTIIGLVKHLALVEDAWFSERFAGHASLEPWASAPFDVDPDWEFHSALDERLAEVVTLYEKACERSRTSYAGAQLDEESRGYARPFTLRFVLVHLIEETARHLGHLDILRELTDGVTGE